METRTSIIIGGEDFMKKFWNVLGQILGFLTIVLYAFLYTDAQFHFGLSSDIMGYLTLAQQFAALAVAAIVGMEFVSGKKLFVFIYILILAIVVIFMFFPDLGDTIVDWIHSII
jgi:hypothetical protein